MTEYFWTVARLRHTDAIDTDYAHGMTLLSRILRIALTPFRWPLTYVRAGLRERAWQIMHDKDTHRGILLRIHFKAPERSTAAITAALDRIAAVDPVSFVRIPHLLPGGIIADATNYAAAWYSIKRKACVIGRDSLRRAETDDLALAIIHELCHARLWERGIGYDDPALRIRVEQICIRREIALAQKFERLDVPPGTYTTWLHEKLSEQTHRDYSEISFRQRHRRQFLQRLRLMKSTDTPRWLRRLVILRARKRLKAQRLGDAAQTAPSARSC